MRERFREKKGERESEWFSSAAKRSWTISTPYTHTHRERERKESVRRGEKERERKEGERERERKGGR